jgi:cell pole-organizing protein PopZ
MSEAKGQPEPSMEEILASIRRIIAEDGDAAAAPSPPPAPSRPAAAEPAQTAPSETALSQDQINEILELTESVAEDGTVVSLTPGAKKSPEPAPPPEPRDVAAEPAEDRLGFVPAAQEQAEPLPEPEPEELPEPPPLRLRSAATVTKRVEPEPVEPPLVATPRAETPRAPEPPPRPAPAPPAAEPAPMVGDRLVSIATAAASVAALSQLADLGQKGQVGTTPLGEAGRTLESLVRELLKPMLRDWMDANLTPLVERLVREEIQRLARDSKTR